MFAAALVPARPLHLTFDLTDVERVSSNEITGLLTNVRGTFVDREGNPLGDRPLALAATLNNCDLLFTRGEDKRLFLLVEPSGDSGVIRLLSRDRGVHIDLPKPGTAHVDLAVTQKHLLEHLLERTSLSFHSPADYIRSRL